MCSTRRSAILANLPNSTQHTRKLPDVHATSDATHPPPLHPSLAASRPASEKQNHINYPLERRGPVVEDGLRRSNCQEMSTSSIGFSVRHLPVCSGAIAGCGAHQAVVLAVGTQSLRILGPWLGTIAAAWILNLPLDDVFGRIGTLCVFGRSHKNFAHVCCEGCSGKRLSLEQQNSGYVSGFE